MGQYTEYATKTLSGCSVAMLNPDKAATSDIYRCACSFQPVQMYVPLRRAPRAARRPLLTLPPARSCLRPACTGDQLQRLTSALSSTWCKDTGGAPTTPTGEAASTPAATGVGATPPGGGGNPSPTNTAEAAGGGGGSGPGQATSTTSRALARETAVPVVGVALAALAGLVADAL